MGCSGCGSDPTRQLLQVRLEATVVLRSISMASSTAKSKLHEIFQSHGWKDLEYCTETIAEDVLETKKKGDTEEPTKKRRILGFVSRVKVTKKHVPDLKAEREFVGKMLHSKKAAEQAAAALVLEFLEEEMARSRAQMEPESRERQAWDFVNKTCSSETLMQDAPLLGEFAVAKRHRNRTVPLGLLLCRASKNQLASFFENTYGAGSRREMIELFGKLLAGRKEANSNLALSSDRLAIRWEVPFEEELERRMDECPNKHSEKSITLLYLPEQRKSMEFLQLKVGEDPYASLASILGAECPSNLFYFGKVGRRKIRPGWIRPCMFASAKRGGALARNELASQLIGEEVTGAVLICRVGPSWTEDGAFLCTNFTKPELYDMLQSTTVSGIYKAHRGSPFLARLPTKYSRPSSWFGKPPAAILKEFCQFHKSCKYKIEFEKQQVEKKGERKENGKGPSESTSTERKGPVSCTLSLDYPPYQSKRFISRPFLSKSAAENSAALSALRYVDGLEVEAFGKDLVVHGWDQVDKRGLDCGKSYKARIPWESILKIGYTLYRDGCIVETNDEFAIEHGSNSLLSAVEEVLPDMQVSDEKELEIQLQNWEESPELYRLELTLKSMSVPEGPGPAVQRLFTPALAVQRYDFAMAQLEAAGARTVVDLGCGEGRLIRKLLALPLVQVVGVDALRSNVEIAKNALTEEMDVHEDARTAFQTGVLLLHGSLTKSSSLLPLRGVDAVVMLEVIEHMDEQHLAEIGPAIFDGLRPSMVVVSTPNFEYNAVLQRKLQALSGLVDDNVSQQKLPYRDADHRFEWTRKKFQSWCDSLSRKFNYTVEFFGIGRLSEDESGPEGYVGAATQGAVFKMKDPHPLEGVKGGLDIPLENEDFEVVWRVDGSAGKTKNSHSCILA